MMVSLFQFCQWMYDAPISTALRESEWTFPAIETVHVLGITLMAGTIAVVDLRLLGLVFRRERVTDIAEQLLPATWLGFVVMLVSGLVLFASEAIKIYSNPAFRLKLVLLILAGLNPLIFHFTVYRRVESWDSQAVVPAQARAAAVLSLIFWAAIIVCGRMIAYFH